MADTTRDKMTRQPIPGETDPSAEVPTQPGIIGGTGYGTDVPEDKEDATLDEAARERSRKEGGGS